MVNNDKNILKNEYFQMSIEKVSVEDNFIPVRIDDVSYWNVFFDDGYGDYTGHDLGSGLLPIDDKKLDFRTVQEYGSMVFDSKELSGWYLFNRFPNGREIRIYKTKGCKKIILFGDQIENELRNRVQLIIKFNENIIPYNIVITTYNDTNMFDDNLPEVSHHKDKFTVYRISDMRISVLNHICQINGSNFGVSDVDYFDSNKKIINETTLSNINNYYNYSLSGITFQKFFLGGYLK